MNSLIIKVSLVALIAFSSQVSNAQANKKVESARKNVDASEQKLEEAKQDSIKEHNKFKAASMKKSEEYKMKIEALKLKSNNANKELKEKYDKRVAELNERNRKLSESLAKSESNKEGKWESFKREINHDMDEIEKAINDLGNDNVK